MADKYCIYTGKAFPKGKCDKEHVIPKSLGGRGSQTIWVSKKANSKFGSMIDGKLGRDFEIQYARMRNGTRGQNGKQPTVRIPHVRAANPEKLDDAGPLYLMTQTKTGGVRLQNQRTRKMLPPSAINQSAMMIENTNIEHVARLKFLLKTFIGIGHQYMLPSFLERVDLKTVREHLFLNTQIVPVEPNEVRIKYANQYLANDTERDHLDSIKKRLCREDVTSVMLREEQGEFEWSVSVLGTLIGSVTVPKIKPDHNMKHKPLVIRFGQGGVEVTQMEAF